VKRTLLLIAAIAAATAVGAPAVGAQGPLVVSGGGTGTFAADLDGDGDIDGSHFGLGVVFSGGSVSGHFECLMAGNADILGLPLMAVEGKVTGGSADRAAGTAILSGTATVNLGGGVIFRGVQFSVRLTAGGPAAGGLQLTVLGAFDGVPGDVAPGNGNYDLPQETVASGAIRVH
jgi:hypothetical protein